MLIFTGGKNLTKLDKNTLILWVKNSEVKTKLNNNLIKLL